MRRFWRRGLSGILAFLMILSLFPTAVFAEETVTEEHAHEEQVVEAGTPDLDLPEPESADDDEAESTDPYTEPEEPESADGDDESDFDIQSTGGRIDGAENSEKGNPDRILTLTSRTAETAGSIALLAGGGVYADGAEVTVTAYPRNGYTFVGWYDAADTAFAVRLSSLQSYSFTIDADLSLVALYAPSSAGSFSLKVNASKYTINGGPEQSKTTYWSFSAGEQMFLRFTDTDSEFLYWVNRAGNILSTQRDFSFYMIGDTEITAICAAGNTGAVLVVFRNAYAQVISSQSYTPGESIAFPEVPPTLMGGVFDNWYIADAEGSPTQTVATDESIWAAMESGETVLVVPGYIPMEETYSVHVRYTDGTDDLLESVTVTERIGSGVTFTAPEIEGKVFRYWKLNGVTVGYGAEQEVIMGCAGSAELEAVYGDAAAQEEAAIVITQTYARKSDTDGKYIISNTMQYYIPEEYIVAEIGFVYGTRKALFGAENGAENLVIGGPYTYTHATGFTDYSGRYTFSGHVTKASTVLFAKAYAVLKDREGNARTVYSDMTAMSYDEFVGSCEHIWSAWSTVTAATCTEAGTETRHCGRCGRTETRTVEALGHDLEHHEAKAATCTEIGWDAYDTCSRCDYTTYAEIPALGHAWSEWAVTTAPTCTEAGVETRTCGRCGETETRPVEALGHDLTHHNAKAATCTEIGWDAYDTCSRCDYTTYVEIPATGHTWGEATYVWADDNSTVTATRVCANDAAHVETETVAATSAVTTDPTCTADGVRTFTSAAFTNNAFAVQTKTVAESATGHTAAAAVIENRVEATCETAGSYDEVVYCTVCGAELSREAKTIPATGHAWGEVTYVWADDNSTVTATRICANDAEHVESETVAATSTVTTVPTCTADGVRTFTSAAFTNSAFAVQTKTVAEEATGHTAAAAVEENRVEATCTAAGSYDEVVYCTVCGAELSREAKTIAALGHDLVHHDAKAATCTEIGWNAYDTCSRCDYTTYVEIPATGHTWGKATYVWADDNSTVTATRVCANDAAHVETETVAATSAVTTAPTCTADGVRTFTSAAFTNSAFAVQTKTVAEPATGHAWGEVTYVWADDNSSVTATRICANDAAHTETETVAATDAVTTKPTVEAEGVRTFTSAAFTNSAFAVQTTTVAIPKLPAVSVEDVTPTDTNLPLNMSGSATQTVAALEAEYKFTAVEPEQVTKDYYGDWNADYRVTFSSAMAAESFGLYGAYGEYGIAFLYPSAVTAGDTVWLVENATPNGVTYNEMLTGIQEFTCGVFNLAEENVNASVKVELVIWEAGTEPADGYVLATKEYTFKSKTQLDCIHVWSEWVVTKAATCTEAGVETRTCSRCGETETRPVAALGHDLVHHDAKAATCTEIGWNAYDTCSRCDYTTYVEIPATGHDWSEPTYVWADDNSTVTATRVCANDAEHVESETVAATSAVTTAPTCTADGVRTFTSAAFTNSAFAVQTKTVAESATGHSPAEAVIENRVEATCETAGSYDEVVYCTVCEAELSRETKTIPATGHDWSEPTYVWADDNSTVTATRICANDAAHTETETVAATSAVTTKPTVEAEGVRTFTSAAFTNSAFTVQTTTVAIPKLPAVSVEDVTPTDTNLPLNMSGNATQTVAALEAEYRFTAVEPEQATKDYYGDWNADYRVTFSSAMAAESFGLYGAYGEYGVAFLYPTAVTAGDTVWLVENATPNGVTYNEMLTGIQEFTCGVFNLAEKNVDASVKVELVIWEAGTEPADGYVLATKEYTFSSKTQLDCIHVWGEWAVTKAPTCTDEGVETRTCSRCEATETRTVEALGHDLVHHDAKAATCTEIGWNAYDTCSRCDYTTYVEIPATGHAWGEPVWAWTGVESATATFTCENDGTHVETKTAAITSAEGTGADAGYTVYTAAVTGPDGEAYSDVTRVAIPYTITYVLNDDETDAAANTNAVSYTVESETLTLAAATRDHYVFGGWYDNEELAGEAVTAVLTGSVGDRTFYAKWTKESYTVTFHTDGGSEVAAQTVEYGAKATKPKNPTKELFAFGAWYRDEALTQAYDFSTPVSADTDLYARWDAAKLFLTSPTGVVTYYSSFPSSLSGSGTYTLLEDVTVGSRMTPGTFAGDVTIDLNGHTITSTATDYAILLGRNGSAGSHKTFAIVDNSENKGGRLVVNSAASAAIQATGKYNDITIGEGVTIDGGCVAVLSENQTVNISGTVNGGGDFAVATNGSSTKNAAINILPGAVLTSDVTALYLPGTGTTTISGGSITGATAVYQKSGTLNISGGTLTGSGPAAAYTHNGSGANATGDALVVEHCDYPGGAPVVNISGGTFVSENAEPIASYAQDGYEAIGGFVSDGEFEKPVDPALMAAGRLCTTTLKNGNNNYYAVDAVSVTFVNGETVLQSGSIPAGETPVYAGETPTRAADAQNTYAFAGWEPAVAAVTEDTTYTATYTAEVNKYPYTVHYYLTGTTTSVADDLTGEADYGTVVDVPAAEPAWNSSFSSFNLMRDTSNPATSVTISENGNVITIYYVLPVTITVEDRTVMFNGDPKTGWSVTDNGGAHVTVTGLLDGDSVTDYAYTAPTGTNANVHEGAPEYVGTFGTPTASQPYYVFTLNPGKLVIEPAPFGLNVTEYTYEYNGSRHTINLNGITIGGGGAGTCEYRFSETEGGPYTINTYRTPKDVCGPTTVYVQISYNRYGETDTNYVTWTGAITYQITPKPITIAANPQTKTWGSADPELTCTVEGLAEGDELTGALARESGEDVGTYAISQGTLTAGDNYTVTFTGADLTIVAPALPTATVSPKAEPDSNLPIYNIADLSEAPVQTVSQLNAEYTFTAVAPGQATLAYYGDWNADYRVTFSSGMEANSFGLYGTYGDYSVAFLYPDTTTEKPVYLLSTLSGVTYREVAQNIAVFDCGVFNLRDENNNKTMKVELVIWKDGTDPADATVITETTYTFNGKAALNCIHDLVHHDAKAATCTEIGWAAYDTCSRCDYTTYVEIPALGHDYVAVVTAPTCTEQGYTTHTCSRCGDSYVDTYVDAIGHDWEFVGFTWHDNNSAEANYKCRNDNTHTETAVAVITDAVTTEPTCVNTGVRTYTATVSAESSPDHIAHTDTATETLTTLGHNMTAHAAVAATCENTGNNAYWSCDRCGKFFSDANGNTEIAQNSWVIAALGHDYVAVVTAPTCTEQGYTTHTCSRCGDSYVDTYVDAIGHDWEFVGFTWHDNNSAEANYKCRNDNTHTETAVAVITNAVTTEPTCVNTGVRTYTATVSAESSPDHIAHTDTATETLTALGHNMTAHAAVAATCETAGNSAYWSCDRCGKFFSDANGNTEITENSWIIAALGHDYAAVVTAPTCTEQGYTTYTCSRCGDTYTDTPVAALGHDFGEWTQTTAPTCTEAGEETRTCSRCGATETRLADALGHDYAAVVTAPTCTEQGYTTHTCSRCNDSYVDTYVDALGHNMTEHAAVDATCTTAGNSAYWSCSACGKHFSDANGENEIAANSWVIAATGHTMTEHAAVAAACTTAGNSAYWSCSACGKYFSDAEGENEIAANSWVIAATGHTMTEHAAVAATCTTAGSSAYWSCSACGKYFSDAEGETEIAADSWVIPATDHSWGTPTWAWTGTTAATATFTCTKNSSHVETVNATITSAEGTGTDAGYTVYTATVSFNGNPYTDIKKGAAIEYTITYDLAGGALAEGVTNPTSYNVASDAITLNNPTREGYEFAGWTGTDMTAATKPVTIATGSTGNRSYTATWNPIVTFKANDGAEPATADVTQTVTSGTATALRAFVLNETPMFSRDGYTFTGWNTLAEPTAENPGTSYTDGQEVTLTEPLTLYAQWEVVSSITFTHSDNFANVDSYLYRVGNGNAVKLGALFKVEGEDTPDSSNVKIKVIGREEYSSVYTEPSRGIEAGSTANCDYTTNASDWTQSTLKFSGEGPVQVIIKEGTSGTEYTLNLEVVNGNNVTSAASATSSNIVLLNDVSGGISISGGKTLYGNGFEVRDTRSHPSGTAGYVTINNGTADNVRFIGYEPATQVMDGYQNADYAPAVVVGSAGGNIYNCYISGGRFALSTAGTTYVKNTVVDGGALANISFAGNLTLEDCETTKSTRGGIIGLGVSCQTNSSNLYLIGNFVQHNWLVASEIPSTYRSILSPYYNSDFAYTAPNGTKYLNMGIFFFSDTLNFPQSVVEPMIHDTTGRNCGFITETVMSHTATCYTPKGSAGTQEQLDGAVFSSNQYDTIPNISFDYTTNNYIPNTGGNEYCYYDSGSGKVNISFEKTTDTTAFEWDPMILSVSKMGNELAYTVTMDGIDYTNGIIPFAETGEYSVQYTYTDPYNYDKDTNRYTSRTYLQVVNLSVTAVAPEIPVYHPDFSYVGDWNANSKTVVISNKSYVMPDISSTNSKFGSRVIDGQTVYFPIIELNGQSSSNGTYDSGDIYFFAPAFTAINITDYNQADGTAQYTYNTSSSTWPHGNSATTMPTNNNNLRSFSGDVFAVKGVSPGAATAPWLSDCNVDNPQSTMAGKVQKVNNLGLCFVTAGIGRDAPKNVAVANQLTEFYYVGNDGTKYYYYIQYNYNQQKWKQGCFATGTLITLADGTQKPIEDITAADKLLAWDFISGEYIEADVFSLTNHGEAVYNVLKLGFDDGTYLDIIRDHGLFDATVKHIVNLDANNAASYIGHSFVIKGADGNNHCATLISAETKERLTTAYSLISCNYLDVIANNVLTADPSIYFLFPFEVDDSFAYDAESMNADIETYGLLTYEEFHEFAPHMTENQFYTGNGQYIKIALGKGIITMEEIIAYAQRLLVDQQYLID